MHAQKFYLVFLLIFSMYLTVFCRIKKENKNSTFYYYAYGSNLLEKRLHINNPSAVFESTAKLEGHRLDFDMQVAAWQGAVATIVEDPDECVWGTVWILDCSQMANLDKQEGVDKGWYFAKDVLVTTPDGREIEARTYELTNNPPKTKELPPERRPSNTYLMVIALGAIESKLPAKYIGFIFSFPTNKKMGIKQIRDQLGYPF